MANLATIAALAELNGAVVVDKPAGMAPHDVVKTVKTVFNLVKVGHGGTIPPNASGVFPVLLGDATRLSSDIMGRDRSFEGVMRLGRTTDTFDREGHTLSEKPFDGVTREKFDAALPEFIGDVFQTEPEYSAILKHGVTGYEIVKTSSDEPRTPRLHHVYRFDVVEFAPPMVSFSIRCTKGLSIRALANDLGAALGCGASIESLRRTKAGPISIEDATPIMELVKLHPADFASKVLPMGRLV